MSSEWGVVSRGKARLACRAGGPPVGARSGLYRGPWSVFREAESDAGHGLSSGGDELSIRSRLSRKPCMALRLSHPRTQVSR